MRQGSAGHRPPAPITWAGEVSSLTVLIPGPRSQPPESDALGPRQGTCVLTNQVKPVRAEGGCTHTSR